MSPCIRGMFRGSPGVVHRWWPGGVCPGVVFASVLLMGVGRLVAVGSVALALAGCSSSDADPGRTPVATPTAVPSSPTTSGTASSPRSSGASPSAVPSIPAAARAHTTAGAEAFARHYLAQVNRAWTIPDASLLNNLALSTCKSCTNYLKTAASLERDGLRYNGQPASVGASLLLPESTSNLVAIQFLYTQNHRSIVDIRGNVRETLPKKTALSEVIVSWRQGKWSIVEMRVVRPS